jgi:hypothetical protein
MAEFPYIFPDIILQNAHGNISRNIHMHDLKQAIKNFKKFFFRGWNDFPISRHLKERLSRPGMIYNYVSDNLAK